MVNFTTGVGGEKGDKILLFHTEYWFLIGQLDKTADNLPDSITYW